jgi:hypothetical protein
MKPGSDAGLHFLGPIVARALNEDEHADRIRILQRQLL